MTVDELNGHWHLRKEVSVGHLISTVVFFFMLIGGWISIEVRLDRMEGHIGSPSHAQTEHRLDIVENEVAQMRVMNDAITNRIDTLLQQSLQSQAEIIRRLERIEDRLNNHAKPDGT